MPQFFGSPWQLGGKEPALDASTSGTFEPSLGESEEASLGPLVDDSGDASLTRASGADRSPPSRPGFDSSRPASRILALRGRQSPSNCEQDAERSACETHAAAGPREAHSALLVQVRVHTPQSHVRSDEQLADVRQGLSQLVLPSGLEPPDAHPTIQVARMRVVHRIVKALILFLRSSPNQGPPLVPERPARSEGVRTARSKT
jgi:hypothetical protein